ncbi:MAG: MFS transporter [Actinomyces urogenitalis]|uniref:MFS transporter n=1 Tax=Actinomyces urogenitalis TaxID=103621 RepID=UPI002A83FD5C|nr:MFS transporter [Actinomyces urogenitalis]MDY3679129.1 MFS transporter [Actinomyces urogenitalis]
MSTPVPDPPQAQGTPVSQDPALAPRSRPQPSPSARVVLTSRLGHLALAMLAVELMAGMQTYINQTVLPLMATDLGARAHYGLVTAAAMVPTFVTMPLGGAMLQRWRADRLMTVLTAVLVAGAVVGALAPSIGVYVLGEVLRGLAAGALATVSTGVLVAGLPEAWRRLFLAASSAMWIVSSLIGPVYASVLSSAWSWRWALVGYVPVLVAARLVMAREVRGLGVSGDDDAPPWAAALTLAGGVALIGLVPASSAWIWPAGAIGLACAVWACARVFPAGVMRLAPGRPAAVATLAWVCAVYFALDFLISPASHDVLGLGPVAVGWALTANGLAWSAVAMWCGARPARTPRRFLLRATAGALSFAAGSGLLVMALSGLGPWWLVHVGWTLAGIGMGLTHQDTMIRCVTDPGERGLDSDGISQTSVATAVTVAGNAGGATLGTLVTSLTAPTAAGVEAAIVVPVVVVLGLVLALTPVLSRRAA